ncbi:MAG: flavin reductase family protein [Alphaproteobacteria bacterium]|nr:flavin reductase family protein [Alphaproteobacteria bacterium]
MTARPAPIDAKAFRQALGAFATGVTIVATRAPGGEPRGFTANSFTSVSLDPPLILICIAKAAASFPIFSAASHFAISVLAERQEAISSLFASKAADKFARTPWREGSAGSPIITGAAAWFDCRRHQLVDAGDHVILIGEVLAFDSTPAPPLGYCRGAYIRFSLAQDALASAGPATRVGAILERDGAIVLVDEGEGAVGLPAAADPDALRDALARLGIAATLDFLFAVFQGAPHAPSSLSVYYRGTADRPLPRDGAARAVPFDQIPWDRLREEAVRSMLQRFVRERREDTFGIYTGDAERGTVQTLARPA